MSTPSPFSPTHAPPTRRPMPVPLSINRRPSAAAHPWHHDRRLQAIATLAIVGLAAVITIQWLKQNPATRPTYVVAVEAGAGVSAVPGLSARYVDWIQNTIGPKAGADEARLFVTAATDRTLIEPAAPIDVTLNAPDAAKSTFKQAAVAAKLQNTLPGIETMLKNANAGPGGVDLVAVGKVAKPILDRAPEGERHLYILADGVNTMPGLNLSVMPLDPASIARVLDRLEAQGVLVSLRGTHVEMLGIGVGGGVDQLSDERLARIQNFWTQFWARTGATLDAYSRTPV